MKRNWLKYEDPAFDADCVIIIGDMNWHQYTYSKKDGQIFQDEVESAAGIANYYISKPNAPTVFGKKGDKRQPWHKSIADMAFVSNLNTKSKMDANSSISIVENFPPTKLPTYSKKNDDGSIRCV